MKQRKTNNLFGGKTDIPQIEKVSYAKKKVWMPKLPRPTNDGQCLESGRGKVKYDNACSIRVADSLIPEVWEETKKLSD